MCQFQDIASCKASFALYGKIFLNLTLFRCAFCDNCVGDWVEGDDPMTEHRNLFPMCPFINGYQVGNIPLSVDDQVPTSPGHDEAGPRWSQVHREPNSVNEKVKHSYF